MCWLTTEPAAMGVMRWHEKIFDSKRQRNLPFTVNLRWIVCFLLGCTFTLRQTQCYKCDVPLYASGFLVGAEISKKTLSMPWREGREREKYE